RDADFVGRYGGEEFVALLPDVTVEGAIVAAEKIRAVFAEILVPEFDHQVTTSIGIAMMPDPGADPTPIEPAARNALYTAKHNRRNRIEIAGGWDAAQLLALSNDAPASA